MASVTKYQDAIADAATGRPVAGVQVTLLQFPSLLPAVVYDSTGSVTTAPIVTDSTGCYSFYATSGRYSIVAGGIRRDDVQIGNSVGVTKTLTGQFFGVHYHYAAGPASPLSPQFAKIPVTPYIPIGFGTFRIWDTPGCTWAELNPAAGTWSWGMLDANVDFAVANNMEVILTLGQAPIWATGGTQQANWNPYNNRMPTSNQYWIDYITAVATRYKGQIKNYEIWNEPNWPVFWAGTTAQMVTLAQLAYTTIKAIDPSATVICPAYDTAAGVSAFDAFLAAGGGAYCDVIGCHLYTSGGAPEGMIPIAQQYRATAYKYGLGAKPIWCTEVGWLVTTDAETGVALGTTRGANDLNGCTNFMGNKQSAAYAMRMYLAAWVSGFDRCCLYTIDSAVCSLRLATINIPQTNTPTVTPAAPAINAAGQSVNRFIQWAVGKRIVSFARNGAGSYLLNVADDKAAYWVLWSDDNISISVALPTETGVGQVVAWDNTATNPLDGSAVADYAPKMLTGNNGSLQQALQLPNPLNVQSVEVDNIGHNATDTTHGVALTLKNATPGTSLVPIQDSPRLNFETQTWTASNSSSQLLRFSMLIAGNPDGSNASLNMYAVIGGVQKLVLNIDTFGQWGVPIAYAYYDARNTVLQKGIACSNSAPATASYNQFSPFLNLFGQGWTTSGAGASKYTGIGFLVTPETGVNNPVGIFKACFAGNNATTPVITNEAFRIEWGERLGFIVNALGLAGFVTKIVGTVINTGTPVYADNASAIAGGLAIGTRYRTSTGIVMEVF